MPDLIEGGQWTTIISKKKKRMERNLGCYVISLAGGEYGTSTSLLTDV